MQCGSLKSKRYILFGYINRENKSPSFFVPMFHAVNKSNLLPELMILLFAIILFDSINCIVNSNTVTKYNAVIERCCIVNAGRDECLLLLCCWLVVYILHNVTVRSGLELQYQSCKVTILSSKTNLICFTLQFPQ